MEIGWGESKNAQKVLVAQANSKAGSLDMPSNFQETLQMHQRYAANNLFIQIYPGTNTAYDQFLESQT